MIRITSGEAKNKKLLIPDIPNIRVVQDIAKLALFSILGDKVKNAEVLDLYAGSGNLGIEALSRGAQFAHFVDSHFSSRDTIAKNLQISNLFDKAEFFFKDVVKFVAKAPYKYNIIFVDPFYENTSHRFLVQNLRRILKPEGVIAFFHGTNLDMKALIEGTDFKIVTERKFGASILTILE